MQKRCTIPLVVRGEVIDDPALEYPGRHHGFTLCTPDTFSHVQRMCAPNAEQLEDLHALKFEEIEDYLDCLGQALSLEKNAYLTEALEQASETATLPTTVLRALYASLGAMFRAKRVRALADHLIGIEHLDGWVEHRPLTPSAMAVRVRAFGSRCVHIIAGNSPTIAATTIVRNAITRSDAIIKLPSNDVLTAVAIARTMIEMAPDHPLTRHLTVAYWKGGDARIESVLYDSRHVDKIVAWGGLDSIRHIVGVLQPGIDLITFDPKLSGSIISPEDPADERALHDIADRLARDIAVMNQEGCFNTRVAWIVCDTHAASLRCAERLGELTRAAMQKLPQDLSAAPRRFDSELAAEVKALRLNGGGGFRVYGGEHRLGTIIVSLHDAPVDFAHMLSDRVANLVPVDDLSTAMRFVSVHTQTISVYPESLKRRIRDTLALRGAQRIVSLGHAADVTNLGIAHDGMEPLRRLCRWIIEESSDGEGFREPDATRRDIQFEEPDAGMEHEVATSAREDEMAEMAAPKRQRHAAIGLTAAQSLISSAKTS